MKVNAKFIVEGKGEGEILVSKNSISFFGEVDPDTGVIKDPDSNLKGVSIKDKILVMPGTRGSTVGSYVIYALAKHKVAPKAILVQNAEPILITGCILGNIPLATTDYKILSEKEGRAMGFDSSTNSLIVKE